MSYDEPKQSCPSLNTILKIVSEVRDEMEGLIRWLADVEDYVEEARDIASELRSQRQDALDQVEKLEDMVEDREMTIGDLEHRLSQAEVKI